MRWLAALALFAACGGSKQASAADAGNVSLVLDIPNGALDPQGYTSVEIGRIFAGPVSAPVGSLVACETMYRFGPADTIRTALLPTRPWPSRIAPVDRSATVAGTSLHTSGFRGSPFFGTPTSPAM